MSAIKANSKVFVQLEKRSIISLEHMSKSKG